jgi:hypothetical protein
MALNQKFASECSNNEATCCYDRWLFVKLIDPSDFFLERFNLARFQNKYLLGSDHVLC